MTDYSKTEDEILYMTNTSKFTQPSCFYVGSQAFHIPFTLGLVSDYVTCRINLNDLIRNPKYYGFITAETLVYNLSDALNDLLKNKWLYDANGITNKTYFEVCNFLFNVIEYCNRTPDAEVGCK